MDRHHEWSRPDRLFSGFRVATMAEPGVALTQTDAGHPTYSQPVAPYGLLDDAVIAVAGNSIAWILPESQVPERYRSVPMVRGSGELLTPGLVDCHTHLVYGGSRAHEWEMRLQGRSYEEIASRGGGILSTVRQTRAASEEELLASGLQRLQESVSGGVTTIEIKSGYGLDLESELKMLLVASRLEQATGIQMSRTLLAAHAIPEEYRGRTEAYVEWICQEMIPSAASLCSAVDAFCETIAFDRRQTERILETAIKAGLAIKVHAEQRSHSGIAVWAAEHGAVSVDHLEHLTESDCHRIAGSGTVATLLPGAFYCLRETQKPPVRSLRESRVPIAIATDCNPGSSPTTSLVLMANMACTLFELTPEEAWLAMTRHAAKALGLGSRVGTLEPGKLADMAIWSVRSPAEVLYQIGGNSCIETYRRGTRFRSVVLDI